MDTTEKGKAYVASLSEAFTNAIEKAYMQGYNDAVEENSKERIKIVEDGVVYIDLGLPSGTLWGLNNPKFVAYNESQKLNIPTREQIDELVKFIRWKIYQCGTWKSDWRFCIIDSNGREYIHSPFEYIDGSNMCDGHMYMWYRSELDKDGDAQLVHLYSTRSVTAHHCFPGYKAYAFLVK